jgi:hypothetical protein
VGEGLLDNVLAGTKTRLCLRTRALNPWAASLTNWQTRCKGGAAPPRKELPRRTYPIGHHAGVTRGGGPLTVSIDGFYSGGANMEVWDTSDDKFKIVGGENDRLNIFVIIRWPCQE